MFSNNYWTLIPIFSLDRNGGFSNDGIDKVLIDSIYFRSRKSELPYSTESCPPPIIHFWGKVGGGHDSVQIKKS